MPGMIKVESLSPSHSLLSLSSSPSGGEILHGAAQSEERGLRLIQLLYLCANAAANNDIQRANVFLEELSTLASLTGDPIQRVATYFMEGLAARITKFWPGLYKALYSTRVPSDSDLAAARHIFFNICPYLKFSFLTMNQVLSLSLSLIFITPLQAILDAMQGEKVVHVVGLEPGGANNVLQWLALLQAFATRPSGPPHLRITVVNSNQEVLSTVGQKLSEAAEQLDIPFQFHTVATSPSELQLEMLGVKTGEAVAVASIMELHRLLAEDVQNEHKDGMSRPSKRTKENGVTEDDQLSLGIGVFQINRKGKISKDELDTGEKPIDRVFRLLHSLSPKIVVTVEQESDHNGPLHKRFVPALHYYSAIFDSLDSTLPQQSSERITVERLIFGQEIRNIVACEGLERVERHETLGQWKKRFEEAHFRPGKLGATALVQAERLLSIHSHDGYKLQSDTCSLTLCWQDTPVLSVSAWEA